MKILRHPIFYSSVSLGSVLYLAHQLNLPFPKWVYFYINDFLCMPIVLSLCLAVSRAIKKTETLYVPLSVVILLTTYFTLHFEWLMPQISIRYTSDIIDVSLYYFGALLFYNFQKRLF